VKDSLFIFLLLAGPAATQRLTAEAAQPVTPFWPIDATTGTRSHTVRPLVPALAQAEHPWVWLTSTCSTWDKQQAHADSTQLYQGQLHGVHAGLVLPFAVQVRQQQAGWQVRS
jgi:hypothetical protein